MFFLLLLDVRIQVSMLAPTMYPATSKLIRMNFPCGTEGKQTSLTKIYTERKNICSTFNLNPPLEPHVHVLVEGQKDQEDLPDPGGCFRRLVQIHYPDTSFRLTKREELSFLTVLALPKDSRMGLACRSCRSNSPCEEEEEPRQPSSLTNQSLGAAAKENP